MVNVPAPAMFMPKTRFPFKVNVFPALTVRVGVVFVVIDVDGITPLGG